MWARKKDSYNMKWHEVIEIDVEYDYKRYYNSEIERRVGVRIPSHTGYNEYWKKDELEFREKVNVLAANVCRYCGNKKLKEIGVKRDITL